MVPGGHLEKGPAKRDQKCAQIAPKWVPKWTPCESQFRKKGHLGSQRGLLQPLLDCVGSKGCLWDLDFEPFEPCLMNFEAGVLLVLASRWGEFNVSGFDKHLHVHLAVGTNLTAILR